MLTDAVLEQFKRDGFVRLPGFISVDQVNGLEKAVERLVNSWEPNTSHLSVFTTNDKHTERLRAKDCYFLESGDQVRFFVEQEAVTECVTDGGGHADVRLSVDKHRALNKIGHALHSLVPEFKSVTFSDRVSACCRKLGLQSPVVCQSMFIFKQPGIGGAVSTHQDASFLFVEPPEALIGFWIALEKADEDNGCLWFLPGSHRGPLYKRFVRAANDSGEEYPPRLVFEGSNPEDLESAGFLPVQAEPGDCVLISGLVLHRSEANRSSRSRHIYTFHVFDQFDTMYSQRNWLQPTKHLPFPKLYQQ